MHQTILKQDTGTPFGQFATPFHSDVSWQTSDTPLMHSSVNSCQWCSNV